MVLCQKRKQEGRKGKKPGSCLKKIPLWKKIKKRVSLSWFCQSIFALLFTWRRIYGTWFLPPFVFPHLKLLSTERKKDVWSECVRERESGFTLLYVHGFALEQHTPRDRYKRGEWESHKRNAPVYGDAFNIYRVSQAGRKMGNATYLCIQCSPFKRPSFYWHPT